MAKSKKILTAVLVLCLTAGGLWLYWGRQIPMSDILPEENWTKLQMWVGDDTSDEWLREIEPPALEAVLSAIEQTKVDRNDKDRNLGSTCFVILLYPEDGGYPTLIYVREYGKIAVAVAYDLDNYQYLDRGEELYEALAELAKNQRRRNKENEEH